ncbi:MAG: tetratricopeptide repeat protein, partial [Bacteroidia bacterium]|nr:tetratricopeptide repeat protein [Bacteroidia bacterium]
MLFSCQRVSKHKDAQLSTDTVQAKYVGTSACISCHEDIYKSYIHTGMGRSWYLPSQQPKIERFDKNSIVFDKHKNLWYRPFYRKDTLYIMEYRVQGKDTIHKRIEKVDYIVGSGHQTRSYIANRNGYLYEFPITWYVKKQLWDLSPGYENGNNTRFDRPIGLECMNCHNGKSELHEGALYQYKSVALGIDCEKCHGKGSEHVKYVQSGKKTKNNAIINPAKLPLDKQIDVCQQCHLQGINVYHTQKEYEPGKSLHDFYTVFLPEYNLKDEFGIASHAERLKRSACFIQSNYKMTCTTCHNPHEVKQKEYNDACKQCHTSTTTVCTAPQSIQKSKNFDCSGCHMPKSGTADIPHVSFTDHYIRKPLTKHQKAAQKQFIGLVCFNKDKPQNTEKAIAWLQYFEKVEPKSAYLDSAGQYLSLLPYKEKIRYFFFRRDYVTLLSVAQKEVPSDGWTHYYIAEAYLAQNNFDKAQEHFEKAYQYLPKHLDFILKLGNIYLKNQQIDRAISVFQKAAALDDKYLGVNNNLGFAYSLKNEYELAEKAFLKELSLHPDNVNAMGNIASLYFHQNKKDKAK